MLSYSVTVIVPVYNGEDYVKDCFYQLKEQSLSDIEVIFVNDGSTDSTQSKLQELIKGNDNFKLINQKNGGVSNARNVGVSQAKGKYIGFVDVDDIYDKDMYEILYNNACENNLDLISMDKIGNFHELTILNRSEAIKKFLMSDIGMSACFKLFRKIRWVQMKHISYFIKCNIFIIIKHNIIHSLLYGYICDGYSINKACRGSRLVITVPAEQY